jgi:hypothetical protein
MPLPRGGADTPNKEVQRYLRLGVVRGGQTSALPRRADFLM